ncbi:hypothetical protein K503DRAFT_786306 [Rhizopogon vinicolor AM-OR11-026]|uniref:Uncharacterized protein n=1 Tax=Rhizopogon vinicolor AM-OR11-026 TaxID=1314800 RepID=A0A1B7MM94_9AGAM|nr:hypothetical protein K503DRAFT_786306 [Rhizopogon vinicolor AM-OR11-026]
MANSLRLRTVTPGEYNSRPSLLLRTRCIPLPRLVDRAACGIIQPSETDVITDAAYEAFALYRKTSNCNDIDSVVQSFQKVLDQCPVRHPHCAAAFSNLVHAILYGFAKGVGTDIHCAISLFRSALALRPAGYLDHSLSVFDLCKVLHRCHLHLQECDHVREAMKLYLYLTAALYQGQLSSITRHRGMQCTAKRSFR